MAVAVVGGRGRIIHAVLGGVVIATIYNGMGLVGLRADAPGHRHRPGPHRRRYRRRRRPEGPYRRLIC
ncbi:MAG: hypothetical protein M3Y36_09910 [Actinomycetota bacterium]|nr:hypothetical protein [Actinomycetota bacterium]